jgi:O-antigen ligase
MTLLGQRAGRMPWSTLRAASRRAAWAACGIVALLPIAAYVAVSPPLLLLGLVAAVFAVTLARPSAGWLALVALSPFGHLLGRLGTPPLAVTEPLVLAFLAGWCLPKAFVRPPDTARTFLARRWVLGVAGLFGLAIAASLTVQLIVIQVSTYFAADFLAVLGRFVTVDYYARPQILPPVIGAAVMLEGVALFVATVSLATEMPALVQRGARVFATAAAVVAVGNLGHLLLGAFIHEAGPVTVRDLLNARIAWVFPDVNAAGSYFVMAVFVAGALTVSSRHRVRWAAATTLAILGLWLSGSRAAFAAAPLAAVGLAAVVAGRRGTTATRAALLAGVVGLALLATAFLLSSERTTTSNVEFGWQVRSEMAERALLMFRDAPIFGIGAGRFYDLSAQYLPSSGRPSYVRENAHNNFLQVLAELGIVGFALLLWLLGVAFGPIRRPWPDAIEAGLASGMCAFILTWVSGHPLLTREVALGFWLVLGLIATARIACEESQGRPVSTRRWRTPILVGCAALIVGLVPLRAEDRLANADLTRDGRGFSQWHRDTDDTRFRWMFRRAVLYVPAGARRVEVPMRSPAGAAVVEILDGERRAYRVLLDGGDWQAVTVAVPHGSTWRSAPLTIVVRAFHPALTGGEPEFRIQVALPRVID